MKKISMGLAILISAFTCFSAMAAKQEIIASCTTKETGGDGVRHGCESEVARINAPENHVFAENSLTGGEVSGAGSEHNCRFSWDNKIEVIPGTGITQATTMVLQAQARGPKGHFSGRGWASCKYSAEMTKYK